MKNSGKLVSFLVPIISILLAFVIGCIIMAVLGANPFVALESLWIGAFGSLRNVGTTLARSTPPASGETMTILSSPACAPALHTAAACSTWVVRASS